MVLSTQVLKASLQFNPRLPHFHAKVSPSVLVAHPVSLCNSGFQCCLFRGQLESTHFPRSKVTASRNSFSLLKSAKKEHSAGDHLYILLALMRDRLRLVGKNIKLRVCPTDSYTGQMELNTRSALQSVANTPTWTDVQTALALYIYSIYKKRGRWVGLVDPG